MMIPSCTWFLSWACTLAVWCAEKCTRKKEQVLSPSLHLHPWQKKKKKIQIVSKFCKQLSVHAHSISCSSDPVLISNNTLLSISLSSLVCHSICMNTVLTEKESFFLLVAWLRESVGGLGSGRCILGLGDHTGVFQAKWFYDSIIPWFSLACHTSAWALNALSSSLCPLSITRVWASKF